MKLENITKVSVLADFLSGSQAIAFAVAVTKDERYRQVECLLKQMVYKSLNRKDKGVVIAFLMKVRTYSRQQITREGSLNCVILGKAARQQPGIQF